MTAVDHSPAQHRASHVLLVGIVAGVYATAVVVAGLLPNLERAGAVSLGLTLDMVVVVPLAFYLLVIRRRRLSIVTLAPILVLSVVAAAQVLPRDHQQTLHVLETLVAPLEFGFIGWITWRAARALRRARLDAAADPIEQLHRAAFELLRHDWAAAVLASEISVFYYAFGSWRAQTHVPTGASAFTHHQRSGHAGVATAFVLVMAVEGLPVHFLLSMWSALAAWVFTVGNAYGALWLIADCRATALRPILVGDESVRIRAGLRWSLRVPRGQVIGVDRKKPEFVKECLNLTFLGTPTHWVTFSQPVVAHGPYGLRRHVRALGIEPDAAEDFERILGSRSVDRA